MNTNISSKINKVSSSDTCVVDNNDCRLRQDENDIIIKAFNSETENEIESLSIDANDKEKNKINFNNPLEFNEIQKTFESEKNHELDIIYNPCGLDFQISAQLVQDAIYGTDIYFKHNRLSLM